MKKLRFRFNKIKWDQVISAALVIVVLVGCVAGLATIFNSKTTNVSELTFKKGALDNNGFFIESDTSIYTKDLIECQGLVIEPDFEANGEYQVFYYGSNKAFVGCTDKMDAHTDGIYEKGDTYSFAKYCRIVISPDAPLDEDGFVKEDWKIRFWEVADYASDYKITVNKKQNDVVSDLSYVVLGNNLGFHNDSYNQVGSQFTTPQSYSGYDVLKLDVEGYKSIVMSQTNPEELIYKFVDANNTVIGSETAPANRTVTISVPTNAKYLYMTVNHAETYLFSGK